MSRATISARKSKFSAIPGFLWEPIAGAGILMVPLALAFAVNRIWLFPSLGPTAYIQATTPEREVSRPYNIIVSHTFGVGAAFLALYVLGALHEPSMIVAKHPVNLRMWASILGIGLTLLFTSLLRANHPPAAGTTLLITIGAFPSDWSTVLNIFAGVLIVTIVGDVARRVRLGKMSFNLQEEIPWRLPFLSEAQS
jgi:HPP family